MKLATRDFQRHEQAIAALLRYGTWLASAIIAVGMAMDALGPFADPLNTGFSGHDIVKGGVAVFILLPLARVALMLALFVRERDYAYSAISALVLAIIAGGIAVAL